MYNTLWLYGKHLVFMFIFFMHDWMERDTGTRWRYNLLCCVKYRGEWWRNTGEKGCLCRFKTPLAKCNCSLHRFSFIYWYDQLIFIVTALHVTWISIFAVCRQWKEEHFSGHVWLGESYLCWSEVQLYKSGLSTKALHRSQSASNSPALGCLRRTVHDFKGCQWLE